MPHSNDYVNQVVVAEHFTDVMNTVNRIQQCMWRMPETGGNEVLSYIPTGISAHNGRVYIARHEDSGGGIDVRDADGGPLDPILDGKIVLHASWRTNEDLSRDEGAFLYEHSDEQHSGYTGFPDSGYWVKIHDSNGNFIRQIVPYIEPEPDDLPVGDPLDEFPTLEDGVYLLNCAEWCENKLYVVGASSVIEMLEPLIDVGSGPATSAFKKHQWYLWVCDENGTLIETHKLTGYFTAYNSYLYGSNALGDIFYAAWFRRTRDSADVILTEDLRLLSRATTAPVLASGDHRVWNSTEDEEGKKYLEILGNIHPPFLLHESKRTTITPGEYEDDGAYTRAAVSRPCIDVYQDEGGAVEDAMVVTGFTIEDLTGLAPDFRSPCINMVRVGDGIGIGAPRASYGVKDYLHEEIGETDEQLGMFIHSMALMSDKLYIIHSRYDNYPTTPYTNEYLFSIRRRVMSEWYGYLKTTKTLVGRFPSPTDFKPYVEGVDYTPGDDSSHRAQDIPRQNLTDIRAALIEILGASSEGGAFMGWPPTSTHPINYYGFFDDRMRWAYDENVPTEEDLWYPIWATNNTTIPISGGITSVKGRGRYARSLTPTDEIESITESAGIATAETAEDHDLAVNDYVWIVAGDFSGIYRVTEIVSATIFKYVIGEMGLDPVDSGTWLKLPVSWARADDRLRGKTLDDIDIGEVRELADVIERAMRHTHGS